MNAPSLRPRVLPWSLVALAAGMLASPACVGDPNDVNFDEPWENYSVEALTSACTASAIRAGTPPERRAIIDRALNWVERRVMYSQTPQASVGGYRTDCSGLVSMAWGLPTPGNTTHSFAGGPWDNRRSRRITWDELEPGDAINYPSRHIMLFAGWLDERKTRFCTIEEYNWGRPASILHHTIYDRSGGRPYRDVYLPIRFSNTPPGASATPAGGGVSSASVGGGGAGGASSTSATCFSHTLSRAMPSLACVQSRFDGQWYQCVRGAWRESISTGQYGACSSSNALSRAGNAVCFSGTYGREVREGVCIESRFDNVWYQCTDTGWVHNPTIESARRGPVGACTEYLPLR
jgi:hypothetical protein